MKIAIAIDAWKLPIFERHLTDAGYAYVNRGALVSGVLVLTVMPDSADALEPIVRAANTEAARTGPPAPGA